MQANVPPQKFVIGSLDAASGFVFQVELMNRGAAINTVKLADYFITVDDKRLYDKLGKNAQAYEEAAQKDPKYKGHYSLLNPVSFGGREYLPLATRSVTVQLPGASEPLTFNLANRTWAMDSVSTEEKQQHIQFSWMLFRDAKPFLRLIKTYTVEKASYSVGVSLEMENLSGGPIRVGMDQAGPGGLHREDIRSDDRLAAYGKLQVADQRVQPILKAHAETEKLPLDVPQVVGTSEDSAPTLWIGVVSKFFGSMMYLVPPVSQRLEAPEDKAQFYVMAAQETDHSRTYMTGIRIGEVPAAAGVTPTLDLSPEQRQVVNFDLFAGPKKRDILDLPDSIYYHPLYKTLDYMGTIDMGGCFCNFSWLTLGMMWLLTAIAKYVTFGNFGLSIIILVLLVRVLLHPLTKKSQVSMMKMQTLGPQMQKLKEKYADDKDALNKETMKLYKEQGATPLLGCLPMFLQMPIWVALWTGLNASVQLRHAAFLPVWITDLAAPDALFHLPWTIPFVDATTFNLLPILLTVATFLQTKLNPQTAQPAMNPDAAKQQQMMKWMMPVMMLFIFYNAPSGLTLYIMASTFAGVIEQYVIKKHIEERQAAAAATETIIDMPGKGSRDNRPRKPRRPF